MIRVTVGYTFRCEEISLSFYNTENHDNAFFTVDKTPAKYTTSPFLSGIIPIEKIKELIEFLQGSLLEVENAE